MDVKQFGPWAAVLDSTGSPVVVTQRERCRSFWPDWEPQSYDANVSACIGDHTEPALESDSNRLAVAQLIAAAPELLEALSMMTFQLSSLISESLGVAGYHMNGDLLDWEQLQKEDWFGLEAARAAIKKAKGEL